MINVRRSLTSYLIHAFWVLLCFVNILFTHSSWPYLWAIMGLVSAGILVRYFFKPYYFEVSGPRLVISRDLFYQDSIEITNIEKIHLEEGPFSKSYVSLKDQKPRVEFNYFRVNDKDFNRLKEFLQVPIE